MTKTKEIRMTKTKESRIVDISHIMGFGDKIAIFNFKTLDIEVHKLEFGTITTYKHKVTGQEQTFYPHENRDEYETYQASSTFLAFYKKGKDTFLAGLNGNIVSKTQLFPNKQGFITILTRNKFYKDLKEIFTWLKNNELGIRDDGNLVKYEEKEGIVKLSHKGFLQLMKFNEN